MTTQINLDAALAQLSTAGFVVLDSVIDPDALAKLRDRVALFYQAWDQYPDTTRKELSMPEQRSDYEPVKEINWPLAALALLDHEPAVTAVRAIIDALVGEKCHIIHVNSLLKPAQRGAPVTPHQDTAYNLRSLQQPLTAWIPFEDVSEENGGLFYIPGSHELGALPHQSADRVHWLTDEQIKATGTAPVQYKGGPGSIGIHDSRIIHGSHANRSAKDRLALSIRFERIS